MKKKTAIILFSVLIVVAILAVLATWLFMGGYSVFMPPTSASLPQDENEYGEAEIAALNTSQSFWAAIESADEAQMRSIADENCTFVHIGMTCKLDEEIGFYTSGSFKPTNIDFHGRSVEIFGDTAIVITDCDYSLLLGGMPTTHHFAVTEVYTLRSEDWKLIQFTFTALTR